MKTRKENVSAVGLSRLYEPDEARDGGFEYVDMSRLLAWRTKPRRF